MGRDYWASPFFSKVIAPVEKPTSIRMKTSNAILKIIIFLLETSERFKLSSIRFAGASLL
jgi:hypothetical protein